ncbi:MAG: hypothetical protein Q4A61_03555 [Porphyromonadaceae bacterium]|nr:hypothetical protein [Porphyromonadaceae bacterium]
MKLKQVIIVLGMVVLALSGIFAVLLYQERSAAEAEKAELVELQRIAMQEELDNLSDEFTSQYNKLTIDGRESSFTLSNDSLIRQLDAERVKVSRLLEELRQVKAASTDQIVRLSKEIGTLRRVLRSYVEQIDSLHARNELLQAENKTIKENYHRAANEVRLLVSEKSELASKVDLAAKLDAIAIRLNGLDKRGKVTNKLSRMQVIAINFTLARNITAEVGNKVIYARILAPNDELLDQGRGMFIFEGKSIPYSISRSVEYNGEETPISMYWQIGESLIPGTYRLGLFEGGNLIGRQSVVLD